MVQHWKLIQKLNIYDIKDDLLKLIESFLSEPRQRIVLGGEVSELIEVKSGVPSGLGVGQ